MTGVATLILITGAPAAGKTWLAGERYPGVTFGRDWASGVVADAAFAADAGIKMDADGLLDYILDCRMARGLTMAIDTVTGVNPVRRADLLAAVPPGGRAELVIVDTPLQVCIDRNAARAEAHRVPDRPLRDMHAKATRLAAAGVPAVERWDAVTIIRNGDSDDRKRG
jgi:protein phosphatase